MGDFADPFSGYSLLLRVIIFGLTPAFTAIQFVRLRRALHVFQLEGYKRRRFAAWCRGHPRRALFMQPIGAKKPLVMTGRAMRILITATALTPLLILAPAAAAHLLLGGWPLDVAVWGLATLLSFYFVAHVLLLADVVMTPVQAGINGFYSRSARERLARINPVVVAVTGSFGKTSTKFAIERLIGPAGAVLATPGSFNTPLGVARTINERLEKSHRFFVVEMGAYGVGEIAALCRFVRPSIAVLTAIGPAHLERFGSMENIARAKYEIVQGLPRDGTAVMNSDDPLVRGLAEETTGVRVVRFGLEPEGKPDITARDVSVGPEGTTLTIVAAASGETLTVSTRLLGRHSIGHVLAAVGVARCIGIPLRDLKDSVEGLEPVEHRLQLIPGSEGITVIDDAYNSNPSGAAAALEVLEAMPGNNKVVVTPGMIELGTLQFEENRRFGEHAARVADTLVVVARLNREALVQGAAGVDGVRVVTVDSLAEATRELGSLLRPGDVVLFENDLPDQFEG